jgi:Tfp pilus assembly protein PilP
MVAGERLAPIRATGRRDPFVSPIVERIRTSSTCNGSGKQCLAIGEITLQGVVHSPSGFIAVVMNGEHTYFLHVDDPLADGAVERITRDSIILRERSSDALGRPLIREVTKKLGVPAV